MLFKFSPFEEEVGSRHWNSHEPAILTKIVSLLEPQIERVLNSRMKTLRGFQVKSESLTPPTSVRVVIVTLFQCVMSRIFGLQKESVTARRKLLKSFTICVSSQIM
jgi:hypothetical protein